MERMFDLSDKTGEPGKILCFRKLISGTFLIVIRVSLEKISNGGNYSVMKIGCVSDSNLFFCGMNIKIDEGGVH